MYAADQSSLESGESSPRVLRRCNTHIHRDTPRFSRSRSSVCYQESKYLGPTSAHSWRPPGQGCSGPNDADPSSRTRAADRDGGACSSRGPCDCKEYHTPGMPIRHRSSLSAPRIMSIPGPLCLRTAPPCVSDCAHTSRWRSVVPPRLVQRVSSLHAMGSGARARLPLRV